MHPCMCCTTFLWRKSWRHGRRPIIIMTFSLLGCIYAWDDVANKPTGGCSPRYRKFSMWFSEKKTCFWRQHMRWWRRGKLNKKQQFPMLLATHIMTDSEKWLLYKNEGRELGPNDGWIMCVVLWIGPHPRQPKKKSRDVTHFALMMMMASCNATTTLLLSRQFGIILRFSSKHVLLDESILYSQFFVTVKRLTSNHAMPFVELDDPVSCHH